MNRLEETSKKTKFRQTLFGVKNNIATVAIASPDNPRGVSIPEEENIKRRQELEDLLEANRIKYFRIEGMYNEPEHSYLMVNIHPDLCRYIFGPKKFDQYSYIIGVVPKKEDISPEELENKPRLTLGDKLDGKEGEKVEEPGLKFFYMERQDGWDDFKPVHASETVHSFAEADNFFSEYLGYKFQIDFDFDKVLDEASNELYNDYGWNPEYRDVIKELTLKENASLGFLYRYARSNLLTESQERKRVMTLEKVMSELGDVKL